MIGYISGKVIDNNDNTLLLENNGIGYEIICSTSAFCRLIRDGQGGVYTYLQVKEDGVALFGFDTKEEKNMFLKLITVSGVGAKMGITILGGMSLKELALAIATSDVKGLSRIKGMGKKTAERIIVELRESMGQTAEKVTAKTVTGISVTSNDDAENAVLALIGLGYTRSIATKMIASAIENGQQSVEDMITFALRTMG